MIMQFQQSHPRPERGLLLQQLLLHLRLFLQQLFLCLSAVQQEWLECQDRWLT